MSRDVSEAAVSFLLNRCRASACSLTFFGGEPILEIDHIDHICRKATKLAAEHEKQITFDLTTNGTLLTKEVLELLSQHGVKFLVSIDGVQECHDASRRTKEGGCTWQSIIDGIPLMKRYQPWLGARMTPTPQTVAQLYDGVVELYAKGINQFIIGPASGVNWSDEKMSEYVDQMVKVAELYLKKRRVNEPFRMTLYEQDLNASPGAYKGAWGCGAGSGRVAVYVDGRLFGCSKLMTAGHDGEPSDVVCLGNVFDGYSNVHRRQWHMDHSATHRLQCQSCGMADDCEGGCMAINFKETGNILHASTRECKIAFWYRVLRERYLRLKEQFPESTAR
jgi:uncharacterized protein